MEAGRRPKAEETVGALNRRCSPAVQQTKTGMPEARGTSSSGALWMLFFTELPIPPGEPAKIVVRMTGQGTLRLWAAGPGASHTQPEEITAHTGSNWNRPGDEWGSIWKFPRPGCWRVHAERGSVTGTVNFMVET